MQIFRFYMGVVWFLTIEIWCDDSFILKPLKINNKFYYKWSWIKFCFSNFFGMPVFLSLEIYLQWTKVLNFIALKISTKTTLLSTDLCHWKSSIIIKLIKLQIYLKWIRRYSYWCSQSFWSRFTVSVLPDMTAILVLVSTYLLESLTQTLLSPTRSRKHGLLMRQVKSKVEL
jgi:hypothetical protein